MEFSEIEKKTSYLYHVKGKTTVRDNVCDFSGEIIIKEIGELIEVNKDVDDLSIDGGIDKEGYIIAEYKLNEDSNQKGTGIFKGILISLWHTNLAGKLKYEDILLYADPSSNNQFQGHGQVIEAKFLKSAVGEITAFHALAI